MRLFTGIALDEDLQRALASQVNPLRSAFPDLRWSLLRQWHVTLQFLGNTDDAHYACIVQHLRLVRAPAVELSLLSPDFFENAGIFHVAVEPGASLLQLHGKTQEALAGCGFKPEARPYSPHITLARRKGRGRSADFETLKMHVKERRWRLPSVCAREFLLYESFTEAAGPRYVVRERFPLM